MRNKTCTSDGTLKSARVKKTSTVASKGQFLWTSRSRLVIVDWETSNCNNRSLFMYRHRRCMTDVLQLAT